MESKSIPGVTSKYHLQHIVCRTGVVHVSVHVEVTRYSIYLPVHLNLQGGRKVVDLDSMKYKGSLFWVLNISMHE